MLPKDTRNPLDIYTLKSKLQNKLKAAFQYIKQSQFDTQSQLQQMLKENLKESQEYPIYNSQFKYRDQFWKIYLKNQIILNLIKQGTQAKNFITNIIQQIQNIEIEYQKSKKQFKHKKNRRLAKQIQKKYTCLYDNCNKTYGSQVSLNLHIKIKHNGGNKSQRQKLAQNICQAEINNLPIPQITLVFPPGYLEAFKVYYKLREDQIQQ